MLSEGQTTAGTLFTLCEGTYRGTRIWLNTDLFQVFLPCSWTKRHINAQACRESHMGQRVEEDPNLDGVSTKDESPKNLLI
jgi:hypothetical protein